MTATIERDTVWFPKHKSRGTHVIVQEVDDESVTVVKYAPGAEPHPMTIRSRTLVERYEFEGKVTPEEEDVIVDDEASE